MAFVMAMSLFLSPILSTAQSVLTLPKPGTLVSETQAFVPALINGIRLDPADPLKLRFMIDAGQDDKDQASLRHNVDRQVKYFLAALTIPEKDMWVNLSPYESDRVVTDALGQTELGRDMLAQDYILKQVSASVIYPENGLGKEFWQKLYAETRARYGNVEIPMDIFNKVWIMPAKAVVFENGLAAYVTQAKLKVMLDSDHMAINGDIKAQDVAKDIAREIILPALEKEVNEGARFSRVRQIFHAMILSKWYRQKIHGLTRVYLDQKKTAGVDIADKQESARIYELYVGAYKKGVFDFIKEDRDVVSGEVVAHKYFSGGLDDFAMVKDAGVFHVTHDDRDLAMANLSGDVYTADVMLEGIDNASVAEVDYPGHTFLWNVREDGLRFDEITTEMLEQKKKDGFAVLWMQGIWEESPFSKAFNQYWEPARSASMYAIYDYKVREDYGGEKAFRDLVARARSVGLRINVDVVPNHMAADSKWAMETPEIFVNAPEGVDPNSVYTLNDYMADPDFPRKAEAVAKGTYQFTGEDNEYARRYKGVFFKIMTNKGMKLLAHGRETPDANVTAWQDTVQIDWSNPKAQERMLQVLEYVADLTGQGGARLDMTHLTMKDIFNRIWPTTMGSTGRMTGEFWESASAYLKSRYPLVRLMAETYWEKEEPLQKLGIDYTYNKYFFEYFVEFKVSSKDVMDFLVNRQRISLDYLSRAVNFLENHDDPRTVRVAAMMPRDRLLAAITMLTTVPGKVLIHNGQMEGRTQDKPNAIWVTQDKKSETYDQELFDFYSRMLSLTDSPLFRKGEVNAVVAPYDLPEGVFAFQRKYTDEGGREQYALVVVNYSGEEKWFSSGNMDLSRWGIQPGEESKFTFKDLLGADDRQTQGSMEMSLKPWEYHVWALSKKTATTDAAALPTGGIDATVLNIEKTGMSSVGTSQVRAADLNLTSAFQGFRPVIGAITSGLSVDQFLLISRHQVP